MILQFATVIDISFLKLDILHHKLHILKQLYHSWVDALLSEK